MSYAANINESLRLLGVYAARILKGKSRGQLLLRLPGPPLPSADKGNRSTRKPDLQLDRHAVCPWSRAAPAIYRYKE
jgi:hypothetical protein